MEFHGGKMHIHCVSKIEPGTGETLILDLLIVTPAIKDAWESRKKVEWAWTNQCCLSGRPDPPQVLSQKRSGSG